MYDCECLSAMLDEVNRATERAERAVDDAIEHCARSMERIAEMEATAKARRNDPGLGSNG
ncbi:hypothetical protein B1C78_09180 [Thioalkalivibrio denitrificans]|uniref:Uncharacterized protein n=1 Tax=Thioalkalivibrio denitrificans TaxID=108003 RepID=A0A1V3NH95_9GAMM|nr:hypothetical protein B1C78_09180 [Thioalkalivibrio denitrificans]